MTKPEPNKKELQTTKRGKRMSWLQYYDDESGIEYEIEYFSNSKDWGVNIMNLDKTITFHIDDLDWFLETLTTIKATSDKEEG